MAIQKLKIHNLRNIKQADINCSSGFNLFYGVNGSGKTSLLEAIYLLSHRKSFREHALSRAISHENPSLAIFSKLEDSTTLGLEKKSQGALAEKLNGETNPSAASMAMFLPLQLINSEGFKLLDSGPRIRREFIDWGLFHVEQEFYPVWKKYQSALKQRNSLLKQGARTMDLEPWNAILADSGAILTKMRLHYLESYMPVFHEILAVLSPFPIEIKYLRGWDESESLDIAMQNNQRSDMARGHTQIGPHRAELELTTGSVPVDVQLSRGQKKILMCALKLAQGQHLLNSTSKKCIYLVDDVAAELDNSNIQKFADALSNMSAQVFVTGILSEHLGAFQALDSMQMFHVKQGHFSLEK